MKKSSGIHEKLCQNKDTFERMNYLHQASLLVSSQNCALASYYGSILSGCAKKAVLRMDHNLKYSICKNCQCPLIPGKTANVRLLSKKKKIIKTVCKICRSIKKKPIKEKHSLWFEQPESLLEILEYKLKIKTNDTTTNKDIVPGIQINRNIKNTNKPNSSTTTI